MDGIQRVLTVLRKSLVTGPALPSEGTFQKPAEPSLPCSNHTGDRTWLSPTCFFGLILYYTPLSLLCCRIPTFFQFPERTRLLPATTLQRVSPSDVGLHLRPAHSLLTLQSLAQRALPWGCFPYSPTRSNDACTLFPLHSIYLSCGFIYWIICLASVSST